jgi:GMP synthase (glutamine-hydrolysing)
MGAHVAPGSIVILDFGGQYAHLIANRVRRLGAFSEIRESDVPVEELKGAAGIILSGGPQSVYDAGSPTADKKIFELGIPILGLCYGHQWLAQALGGKVESAKVKEYGKTRIELMEDGGQFLRGLPQTSVAWMSHGDAVTALPPGFTTIIRTKDCAIAGMADDVRKFYGIQFHVEVTHTEQGMEILKRFVGLCEHAPWSIGSFSGHVSEQMLKEVGHKKVFMLVSGGVDSTVAFTLLNEVLGHDRVVGLLVDTGLMRKDEVKQIQAAFKKLGIMNLHVEDASEKFFAALKDAFDPEEKRRIIGRTFVAVQQDVSKRMNLRVEDGWLLGQGTIYPDTIETGGTKHADHIKTHHNRVDAIQEMMEKGLVIEPLKELYKDEVRRLGEELGLPHDLVWRHPFPGPGLGVRILCESSRDPWVEKSVAPLEVSTALPHAILPVRSVGVQGDGRTYRHAVAFFQKDPSDPSPELLELAVTIPNAHAGLNRVLLCTSHDERQDFTITEGFITRERADLLREADAIVDAETRKAELYESIWQFPVVLLPCGIKKGGQSIVLRPIASTDAMTANAFVLPPKVLSTITKKLMKLPGIDAVFFDLTSKPPGTIEWE